MLHSHPSNTHLCQSKRSHCLEFIVWSGHISSTSPVAHARHRFTIFFKLAIESCGGNVASIWGKHTTPTKTVTLCSQKIVCVCVCASERVHVSAYMWMGRRKSIGAYKWYLLRLLFSIFSFSSMSHTFHITRKETGDALISILFHSDVIRNIEWLYNITGNWGGFDLWLFLWIGSFSTKDWDVWKWEVKYWINWNS